VVPAFVHKVGHNIAVWSRQQQQQYVIDKQQYYVIDKQVTVVLLLNFLEQLDKTIK